MKKTTLMWTLAILLIISLIFGFMERSGKNQAISDAVKFNKQGKDMFAMLDIGALGSIHEHADFKMYINGQAFDLSQQKYQVRVQFVHVEEGIGEVIHSHASGITLGHFLNSLGFQMTEKCLITDKPESFCNTGLKTLKVYINGKKIDNPSAYVIKDFDKILVSYGSESEEQLQKQLKSVTDLAKTYSKDDSMIR